MDVMYEKLCARVSLWFITCPAVVHLYIIQALCYRMSSSIVYFWVCNVTHVLRVFFLFFSFSENSWNLLQHEESAQARAPSPSFFFFSDSNMETCRWDVKNSTTFMFSVKSNDSHLDPSSCDSPRSFLTIHVVETGNKTVAKSLLQIVAQERLH